MLGVTRGGNVGVKGAGTLLEAAREDGVRRGIPKATGLRKNREEFCVIFCNRIKHQEVARNH